MLFRHAAILTSSALGYALAASSNSTSSAAASTSSIKTLSPSSGCSFKTLTVTDQSNLDKYSSCDAVSGTIYIEGSIGSASIGGIKQILGSLIVSNATSLSSLSADSLELIDDEFQLTDLTVLGSLSFPVLTKVGSINWVTLPGISQLSLTNGITEAGSVLISDTTLTTLDGISVINVETFNLNNNNYLETFDSSLQTVSNSLSVTANGDSLEATFDDLIWANNITISKCSNVSFASLQAVNGTIHLNNNSLEDLTLDNLTTVGETISFIGNDQLTSVSIDQVTSLSGDLVVENNSDVRSVSFDKLKSVSGSVNIIGNISNATFDALKSVRGSLTLKSDGDVDCSALNKLAKAKDIEGSYVCKGASSSYSAASGSGSLKGGSKKSGSSDDSSSSSDVAGIMGLESTTIVGAVIAMFVSLL